jgi:hypothetical protein
MLGEPITTAGLKTRRGGYEFCDFMVIVYMNCRLIKEEGGNW